MERDVVEVEEVVEQKILNSSSNTSLLGEVEGEFKVVETDIEKEAEIIEEELTPEVENAGKSIKVEHHEETEEELAEEHQEEQQEEPLALMFLGGISFVTFLMVLTHCYNEDVKYFVWKVISSTMSILVAVMLFTTIDNIGHKFLLDGMPRGWHDFWDVSQCLVYIIVMQVTVALCVFSTVDAELKMKSYGMLLAHASGFAAMNAGGILQQGYLFDLEARDPFTWFVAIIMAVILWLLFVCCRLTRGWVTRQFIDIDSDTPMKLSSPDVEQSERAEKVDTAGAYKIVASEEPPREDLEASTVKQGTSVRHSVHIAKATQGKWEATIYEAENDVSALCVSFLTSQALRSNITGVMPDELGNEVVLDRHNVFSIKMLAFCSVLASLVGFKMEVVAAKVFSSDLLADMGKMSQGFSWSIFFFLLGKRCALVGAQAGTMVNAWALLADFQWMLHRWCSVVGDPTTIGFKISLSILITAFGFFITLVLDAVAASEKAHLFSESTIELIDRIVMKSIVSLGLLVGFAWEHSFDRALEVLSDVVPCPSFIDNPQVLQLTGSMFIGGLLVFAWRKYVLKEVLELEAHRELHGGHVN